MFRCSQCGECCRQLQNSSIYKELHDGSGVCRYLVGDKCSIYESRPIVCRVDEFYETHLKESMSRDEFYELNYKVCETLQALKGE